MLVAQGRFFNSQYGQRTARSVSRGPMNILVSELRMVQDNGGVAAAAADGKRVRLKVPYRFGIVCGPVTGATVATMLPVDSSVAATYAGWAWRAVDGTYSELPASDPLGADSLRDVTGLAGEGACTARRIHKTTITLRDGATRTGRVLELRPPAAVPEVAPVFLWQYVAFEFKASTAVPGTVGLYRVQADGTPATQETEVMAPFDTSARFRFFVPGRDTSLVEVPGALADIRGLDLVLTGAAATATPSATARAVSRVTTAVFFKNVRAF
jgi:hypothetical protein